MAEQKTPESTKVQSKTGIEHMIPTGGPTPKPLAKQQLVNEHP